MKTVAYAASNSKNSFNKALVKYAASLLPEVVPGMEVEVIDINDYAAPIYSYDHEMEHGVPEEAVAFKAKLAEADCLLISFAEHNGSYVAAYKSLFDWTTRTRGGVFKDKKMVLLSTSPGPKAGSRILETAATAAPYFGGEVIGKLPVPSFFDTFDLETGKLVDEDLIAQLKTELAKFGEA